MNEDDGHSTLHLLCVAQTPQRRRRLEACAEKLADTAGEGPDWHSSSAPNAKRALAILGAGWVDAALVDLDQQPALDFLQLARNSGIVTPLLVVTADADAGLWRPLLEAGADEFLPADELTPLLLERSLRLCSRNQALESRLEYLAQHDMLTGLPNARLFERQLDLSLHTAERHGRCMALMCVHLDEFQARARSLGQEAAELLLKQSARRLRALLRRSDLVARSHNEEFLLLLECSADLSDLALTASRILEALAGRDATDDGCRASLGIAVFPHSSSEPRQLLDHARVALNQVRDAGGNDFRLYDEALEVVSHRRVLMESALPGAIQRNELSVRFQPRFDLRTRRITGAEVLLRWDSPDFGAVSPEQFIPAAEATGAINRIGGWVLEQTIRAGRQWLDAGHRLRLAVNVSGGQFRGGEFANELARLLEAHGLPAELLELELTEGVFVANVAEHRDLFTHLTALGVGLAVDDFGTGYSALAYLRHFPVHALKIDRTFIAPLPASEDDGAIVRAIVAMGHALDLRVVAEGVDAIEQIRFLEGIGCDEIQGYLVGMPMTAEELNTRLEQHPGASEDAWPA